MNASVTELLYVSRDISWLPWAVQYFFLIGLSIGCFLVSLPGLALERADWRKAGRLALTGALACGMVAPVALLSDLHQPGRFMNFYLHPQASSWMSWGSFFIPIYLGGLMLYAWAALRPELARMAPGRGMLAPLYRLAGGPVSLKLVRAGAAIALAGGALVALYTGAEVMVVASRPLWHTPLLPVQFLATAVAGAIGLVLILNRMVGGADSVVEARLNRALAWALAAVLLLWALWLAIGLSGLSRSHAQALAEVAPWHLTGLWLLAVSVVPLVLALRFPAGSGWATGAIALLAAWSFRWTVFIGGQTIPKTGAGYYHYSLPLGPEGLLGIVGTAGLWLFVLIVLVMILPPAGSASKGV